jgi:hypothetical protein
MNKSNSTSIIHCYGLRFSSLPFFGVFVSASLHVSGAFGGLRLAVWSALVECSISNALFISEYGCSPSSHFHALAHKKHRVLCNTRIDYITVTYIYI